MANMSYCRFRNTLEDLRDCQQALHDAPAVWTDGLSEEEAKAAKWLIKLCRELADDYGDD